MGGVGVSGGLVAGRESDLLPLRGHGGQPNAAGEIQVQEDAVSDY